MQQVTAEASAFATKWWKIAVAISSISSHQAFRPMWARLLVSRVSLRLLALSTLLTIRKIIQKTWIASTNLPGNCECKFVSIIHQSLLKLLHGFRTNPNLCGVRMKTIKFDLQSPMDTPFGGACSDFFHMPSCGFLCGKMEFSCMVFIA